MRVGILEGRSLKDKRVVIRESEGEKLIGNVQCFKLE